MDNLPHGKYLIFNLTCQVPNIIKRGETKQMQNKSIRIALMENNMRQYELAELMGIHDFSLSRKLRHELPKEEQERIISLIKRNAKNCFLNGF